MRGSIPDLAATISEIGDLLLPSRDMAEMVPGSFALFTFSPWVVLPLVGSRFGTKATQILKTINQSTNDYRKQKEAGEERTTN